MIRYQFDFGSKYFAEHFRNSRKIQERIIVPDLSLHQPVSVVTTCMNRLSDLRLTLPKNIEDNQDHPCEFVLLNYGGYRDLDRWVRQEMQEHIESGKLVYYSAPDQNHFRPNHSRNLTFRLASNQLIANVDADNFTHAGYLKRISQCAVRQKVLVVPESFLKPGSKRLVLRGRFAMFRDDIFRLGGFDEDLDFGYSQDDINFVLRSLLDGFHMARYEDSYIQDRIETPMNRRIQFVKRPDLKRMKDYNALLTREKLSRCAIRANRDRNWGSATVIKNFSEEIIL